MSRQSRGLAQLRHQQLVQLRHHRPRTQQPAERRVWLPLQLQQDGGQAAGAPFFHSCLLSLSQAASHSQNPVLSLQLPALLPSHWRTALSALRPIWFKTKEIKNQVTEGYLHQELSGLSLTFGWNQWQNIFSSVQFDEKKFGYMVAIFHSSTIVSHCTKIVHLREQFKIYFMTEMI